MLKTYCLKPEFNAVPSQVTQNTIQNGLHLYVYTNIFRGDKFGYKIKRDKM